MPESSVRLVKASEKDIPLISELAKTIWQDHYVSIIGQEQVDYMLGKMYSQVSLIEQFVKKSHLFYLVEYSGKTVGFISVCKDGDIKDGYFINKFYLLQNIAGKGIGSAAFMELVYELRPETFRLTVNRQNFKSINFYFKNGFTIERVADFDIGDGFVMNDFVMIWDNQN